MVTSEELTEIAAEIAKEEAEETARVSEEAQKQWQEETEKINAFMQGEQKAAMKADLDEMKAAAKLDRLEAEAAAARTKLVVHLAAKALAAEAAVAEAALAAEAAVVDESAVAAEATEEAVAAEATEEAAAAADGGTCKAALPAWKVGDAVEAAFNAKWCAAKVTAMEHEGSYIVSSGRGSSWEVDCNEIRAVGAAEVTLQVAVTAGEAAADAASVAAAANREAHFAAASVPANTREMILCAVMSPSVPSLPRPASRIEEEDEENAENAENAENSQNTANTSNADGGSKGAGKKTRKNRRKLFSANNMCMGDEMGDAEDGAQGKKERKWHKMQKEAAQKKRNTAAKYDPSSLQQMKLEVDRVYGRKMRR
jgi:hypothetical protein